MPPQLDYGLGQNVGLVPIHNAQQLVTSTPHLHARPPHHPSTLDLHTTPPHLHTTTPQHHNTTTHQVRLRALCTDGEWARQLMV